MRVIVVNGRGGQLSGAPLGAMLRGLTPAFRPLVAIISEADAPVKIQDRLINNLQAAMPDAEVYHGSKDHGAREVAVLVNGKGWTTEGHESRQLLPGHGWHGTDMDRWIEVVRGTYSRKFRAPVKVAIISAHAPTDDPSRLLPGLTDVVRELRGAGYRIVLGGDLNERATPGSKIAAWAQDHHLAAYVDRVMWGLAGTGVTVQKAVLPIAKDISDHPTALQLDLTFKSALIRKRAPKPYAKTTERNGKTIDQLTNYALYAVERHLGYTPGSITVVQGSYNAGAVSASAGTHDGGGVVDLTAQDWENKVHALRAVGFAAWHRPFNWDGRNGGEHIHAVLIGNAKLSPSAAAQVVQYRAHTNGLASHGADNTWHPDPIPTFAMPKWAVAGA